MKQFIKIQVLTLVTVLGATLLLYQNCSHPSTATNSPSANLDAHGNGEGYEGMVSYVATNPSNPCATAGAANSQINVFGQLGHPTAAFLSMQNCVAVNPPVSIPLTSIQFQNTTGDLVYQNTSYHRPWFGFGGMYSSGFVNPMTGSPSCPAGYTQAQIAGYGTMDLPLYYCYIQLASGQAPDYDYGGIWGIYQDSTDTNQSYLNPVTNTSGCPAGYTQAQVYGTLNVDNYIYICYRPKTPTGGYAFDGFYSTYANMITGTATCPSYSAPEQIFGSSNDTTIYACLDGATATLTPPLPNQLAFGGMYSTGYNNPTTGGQSCPAGYTVSQILGSSEDTPLYSCYKALSATQTPDYDFGGIFGFTQNASGATVGYVNPITGSITPNAVCPVGYTEIQTYGTVDKDNDIFFCYRIGAGLGGAPYYGLYSSGGQANYDNSDTGDVTCPSGANSAQIFGGTKDSPLYLCH